MTEVSVYDCIIVGGGPAGLSAALLLARSRRRVLVCDEGITRNRSSDALHGYLTRDGTPPAEFGSLARRELERYDGITWIQGVVTAVERNGGIFTVHRSGGGTEEARTLVLATGMQDTLPDIEGLQSFYGTSVHHCPYCDGWEHRDEPLAVYGRGSVGALYAQRLLRWSRNLTLCTDGESELDAADAADLERHGIVVRPERIARLAGAAGKLRQVEFDDGSLLEVSALFFCTGHGQRSGLIESLGVALLETGEADAGRDGSTNIDGLYVIGDASRDAQLIIMAAAEGAAAGVAINEALTRSDLARGLDPA